MNIKYFISNFLKKKLKEKKYFFLVSKQKQCTQNLLKWTNEMTSVMMTQDLAIIKGHPSALVSAASNPLSPKMPPKYIIVLLLALMFAAISIADEYPKPVHDEKPPHEKSPHENPPHEKPPHEKPAHEKPPHEKPPDEKPPHGKAVHSLPCYLHSMIVWILLSVLFLASCQICGWIALVNGSCRYSIYIIYIYIYRKRVSKLFIFAKRQKKGRAKNKEKEDLYRFPFMQGEVIFCSEFVWSLDPVRC